MRFATWMGEATVGQIPYPPPPLLPQKTAKRKWSLASTCSGNFFWLQKFSQSHCHGCNWPLLLWMFPSFPFGWFLKVIFTKKKEEKKVRKTSSCPVYLFLKVIGWNYLTPKSHVWVFPSFSLFLPSTLPPPFLLFFLLPFLFISSWCTLLIYQFPASRGW